MKYYISQTRVFINEQGKIDGHEVVLTKPDTHKATNNMFRKMTAIGIENLHVCMHKTNDRRWGKLHREQNKRHKTRKLTVADLAPAMEELEKTYGKEKEQEQA